MVAPRNPNQINVNIAVDVIRALSEESLKDNLYMMDNNPFSDGLQSSGQGTDYLTTSCTPGQVIKWVVHAIDLQTPVSIRNIEFIVEGDHEQPGGHGVEEHSNRPDLKIWTGIVPSTMVVGQPYRYRVELQMGDGQNSVMSVDSAALKRIY